MATSNTRIPASPTKRFFIDMLTRDIELQDAILDLLDNCVDGIQRSRRGQPKSEVPYEGFFAKISFNSKAFEMLDNCGGIPLDLAKKYAFMMGRPREEDDGDIPTVGMYGIGMKRALFKIGQSSTVTSQTATESFKVTIVPKWLTDDNDWELPLSKIAAPFRETGTEIKITNLRDGIPKIFSSDGSSSFERNLIDVISHHFAFIIKKGFKVTVNGTDITAKKLTLLWSEDDKNDTTIAPYMYRAQNDGVEVSLAVGFYTPMIDSEELEEEQITRRSKEDAGWTVICNDRVVVYNDKTRLTGWGEAGVPNYHTQFIGISGVVYFKSNDAWKLPITTTKRGLDTSSELYLYVKEYMREGLKKFTNYTNIWKGDSESERKISSTARSVPIEKLLQMQPDQSWSKVRNRPNEFKLNLALAAPKNDDPSRQIRFTRKISEIATVAEFLFEDPGAAPADVGDACFSAMLAKAEASK